MRTEVAARPSFAHIRCELAPGERVIAEADAMASMSSSIQVQHRWNGDPLTAVLRRVFGGETLFVNEFFTDTGGELVLTQPAPGDIECVHLRGQTLHLQPGAFLACEAGVRLRVGFAGWSSYLGGQGLFRLTVSGHGRLWFGAYGGIFARDVQQPLMVDAGHLVAYEPTVGLHVRLSGGPLSSLLSGEGVVTQLRGPGRVYMQTRSVRTLAAWSNSHLL